MRFSTAALGLASFAVLVGNAYGQASLTELETIGGRSPTPNAVSADGKVVVGKAGENAARWDAAGRIFSLGALNGGIIAEAFGANRDGSIIVGFAEDGAANRASRAFRWTASSGIVSLGTLNGGTYSRATGVSADGSTVVGVAGDGAVDNRERAFRWTAAGGMVSLGTLANGTGSYARGVNADGSVVVGYSQVLPNSVPKAFRWSSSEGMQPIDDVTSRLASEARGVSADGSTVVGFFQEPTRGAFRAFRWTAASGMVNLGSLQGVASFATAASADGNVVVGYEWNSIGLPSGGFRWSSSTGMQLVEDWLRANGAKIAESVRTSSAEGVSADGNVVTGRLQGQKAYIARVGSGLVTINDFADSLRSTGELTSAALKEVSTVLNAAHSRPLSSRTEAGRNVFWASGDWGNDNHGNADGHLGLAEVGAGHNFGPVQINASLGHTRSKQEAPFDSRLDGDGDYLMLEVLIPLTGSLWGVVSGYGHQGSFDIRRGYLNGGIPDASLGNTDARTVGGRVRLEWDKAVEAGGVAISVYADYFRARARMDAYTETGGGFPAMFDRRKETVGEARVGVHGAKPIWANTQLLSQLEGVRRFDRTGVGARGEVIGLFGFDLDGRRYERDWLRAGIGLESKVGGGVASVMLNTTTRGEAPNAWIAASYQIRF